MFSFIRMRVLKFGSEGPDVEQWEIFLKGCYPNERLIIDDYFGNTTTELTKKFQKNNNIGDDGIVGRNTYASAMLLGFDPGIDDDRFDVGPNFPPRPDGFEFLTHDQRISMFGEFKFKSDPVEGNHERIKILDDWPKHNIKLINIPQLKNVSYAPKSCNVYFHVKLHEQVKSMFNEFEKRGFKDKILTWGGSWVARYIRGSQTRLSNHSWATAFDINVPWNMLGTQGALLGEKGSVRELVQIAYEHGFASGLWFRGRTDGQHFEAYKIL